MKLRAKVKDGAIEEAWIGSSPLSKGDRAFPTQTIDKDTEFVEVESVPFDMKKAMSKIVARYDLGEEGLVFIVKE